MQNTVSTRTERNEDNLAQASEWLTASGLATLTAIEQAQHEINVRELLAAPALPSLVSVFTWRFVDSNVRVSYGADMMRLRLALSYVSALSNEAAAEEAFHVTNAPRECLDETQLSYLGNYRGPSLSVGDYVLTNENAWLCTSHGWEQMALADVRQALTVEKSCRNRFA